MTDQDARRPIQPSYNELRIENEKLKSMLLNDTNMAERHYENMKQAICKIFRLTMDLDRDSNEREFRTAVGAVGEVAYDAVVADLRMRNCKYADCDPEVLFQAVYDMVEACDNDEGTSKAQDKK